VASAAPRLEKLKLVFYEEVFYEWSEPDDEDEDAIPPPPPLSEWLRSLKHPCLRCLDLSDCDWGDEGGDLLCGLRGAHLPHLVELDVGLNLEYAEQCAGVNNRSVQHLARAFPRLQSLNLEGNHQVGDVAVLALAKHCSGLITLNLQHTSVSVDALVRYLPKLRKLVRLAVGNFFL
jgi:hypothetical protein